MVMRQRRSMTRILFLCFLLALTEARATESLSSFDECSVSASGEKTCDQERSNEEEQHDDFLNDEDCTDIDDRCHGWMKTGECDVNPLFMLKGCKKSCGTCGIDNDTLQALMARRLLLYEASGDETILETPYGMSQDVPMGADSTLRKEIEEIMQETELYMETEIFVKEEHSAVKKKCKNRNRSCAHWKALGKCDKAISKNTRPAYIHTECAPICQTCHMLDFKYQCPLDFSVPHALPDPGDLHKLFTHIVTDEYYQQYQPNILAMPNPTEEQRTNNGVLDGPWVVVLDEFLTEQECDRLVELGTKQGYEGSTGLGRKKFDNSYEDVLISGRTSANTWCSGNDCYHDATVQGIQKKISNLTGVPEPHFEHLQLLKYNEGEYYFTHNDLIPHHFDRQQGVRILTVFLYLNDVEAGGGTEFPVLGMTVMPKKRRAVIWPSVLNEDPHAMDIRTDHGALPVEKGTKYGANAWIHQRDFQEPFSRGCI